MAPNWAQVEGAIVRAVSGDRNKTYVCPGCLQDFSGGRPHLVVIDEEDASARRHWHTPCWRIELRRRGRS